MKKIVLGAGILCAGLIGPLIFIFQERLAGLWGFPLDDAWIHLTYARSLADGRGWSYAGGPSSAGSTSPFWTLLQIPAFGLHLPVIAWSYGLGIIFLFLNAIIGWLWIRKWGVKAGAVVLFFALGEWHLVWASLSGMETLFFCCWVGLMVYLFFPLSLPGNSNPASGKRLFLVGILAGLGIGIRPEALLLLLFVFASVGMQLFSTLRWKLWPFCLGAFLPVAGYLTFNLVSSGRPFPNTFYVKAAEYAAWTSQSIIVRFFQSWIPLIAGPAVALLPFAAAAIILLLRSRKFIEILPFGWALCHVLLYAIRLPATYQHGRYFLPVLLVLIGYGVYGFFALKERVSQQLVPRIAVRATWASALILTGIFLIIGSSQFSADVSFIQTNMVDMALWIRTNTPVGAVIAAHDIGALGFFGERRLVDLGGVTDLEALPLLSGKTSLQVYLSSKHADFLMTLEGSYPGELEGCTPLHIATESESPPIQRMMLFDWPLGCIKPH
jgi:arabinofuranosyltransferase